MKVYFAEFKGIWHQGTAIIVAQSKPQAMKKINNEIKLLKDDRISGANRMGSVTKDNIIEVDTHKNSCLIIDNGDE
jgi:hypothetical protein